MEKQNNIKKGEVKIYKPAQGEAELRVRLEDETVWLSLDQMADLFGRHKSVISRHLKNIFKEGELTKNSVVAKIATTASDGKNYQIEYYSLDAIISVGYRVNSKRATQFRIWSTKVLKSYLIEGYAVNRERLKEAENKFKQLQQTINFLQQKSEKERLQGQEKELLNLITDYANTFSLLEKYDKNKLKSGKGEKTGFVLEYENCLNLIGKLKEKLVSKNEASEIFGNESGHGFESVVGNLYQTFGGKELYKSIEDKASHLLYLTIKDHPFTDGNKRIASFLFVYFLDKNNYLYRESGEKKINDNALTALALLVAESDPGEKDQIIALIYQLLKK